jgi:hypothetical protein
MSSPASRGGRGPCSCLTPDPGVVAPREWSRPPQPVVALHAVRERRRDDSTGPTGGPVAGRGTGDEAGTARHRTGLNVQEYRQHRFLRCPQRAPRGVGVKDLRPLRGRPFGPIPDPDALLDAAQQHPESAQGKDQQHKPGLTGPAPSGMTRTSGDRRGSCTLSGRHGEPVVLVEAGVNGDEPPCKR